MMWGDPMDWTWTSAAGVVAATSSGSSWAVPILYASIPPPEQMKVRVQKRRSAGGLGRTKRKIIPNLFLP